MKRKRASSRDAVESRFVVTFSGSCAFVPNTGNTRFRVLFPRDPGGWQTGKGPIVPPHRAFMMFRMLDLADDSPRKPDFIYLKKKEIPTGICFLQNEVISLPSSQHKFDFNAKDTGRKPLNGNRGSIFWIADISAFCNAAKLKTQNLSIKGSTDLAAIVDIRAGFMKTNAVSKDVFTVVPPPDTGDYEQCLAEEVSVSSIAAGPYQVRSSKKGSNLLLKANAGETRLEIANEVLDDIILPPGHRRKQGGTDYDFDLLYRLTQLRDNDASHRHLPQIAGKIASRFIGHGTPACKVGMFPEEAF